MGFLWYNNMSYPYIKRIISMFLCSTTITSTQTCNATRVRLARYGTVFLGLLWQVFTKILWNLVVLKKHNIMITGHLQGLRWHHPGGTPGTGYVDFSDRYPRVKGGITVIGLPVYRISQGKRWHYGKNSSSGTGYLDFSGRYSRFTGDTTVIGFLRWYYYRPSPGTAYLDFSGRYPRVTGNTTVKIILWFRLSWILLSPYTDREYLYLQRSYGFWWRFPTGL